MKFKYLNKGIRLQFQLGLWMYRLIGNPVTPTNLQCYNLVSPVFVIYFTFLVKYKKLMAYPFNCFSNHPQIKLTRMI